MAPPGGVDGLAQSVRDRTNLPAGRLLVALSGGADSAVCAWLVAERPGARAVFVDHGLPFSSQLGAAAGAIARRLDLPFDTVPAPVDPASPSFEDVARRARYAALSAAGDGYSIVTGHTADDQAETVLGNVLRGSGTRGLAGIPARRPPLVRPMLGIWRWETRALADQLELPYIDDPDNASPERRRNRLRSQLIPQLEREYNPQLRSALLRTAAIAREDDDALEQRARAVPIRSDLEAAVVSASLLQVLPRPVAVRAVRSLLTSLRGPQPGNRKEALDVLAVAAGRQAGAELADGLRVEREGAHVAVFPPPPPAAPAQALTLPAHVRFDRWDVAFDEVGDVPPYIGSEVVVADADRIGPEVGLRAARLDERIEIGTGSKRVGDALAEGGVPRRLRHRWPVLEADGEIVLIPGVRVAAAAWRREGTTRYLVARISVIGPEGT